MTMPPQPRIQIITPNDDSQDPLYPTTSVFLSGATTFPWREVFLAKLRDLFHSAAGDDDTAHHHHHHHHPGGVTVYAPFQPNWTAEWREDLDDASFRVQVGWELARQDGAAVVAVFFDARSQSPVSLLEFGLCARSGKAVVGCDRDFWKRGNVEAVCQRYGVPMADDVDGLVALVLEKLRGIEA